MEMTKIIIFKNVYIFYWLALMTLYLRYRMIRDLIEGHDISVQKLAIAALVFGTISALGLSVLGNFQVRKTGTK